MRALTKYKKGFRMMSVVLVLNEQLWRIGAPLYTAGGLRRRPWADIFNPSPSLPISAITRDPFWYDWPELKPLARWDRSPSYIRDSYLSPVKRTFLWDKHPIRPLGQQPAVNMPKNHTALLVSELYKLPFQMLNHQHEISFTYFNERLTLYISRINFIFYCMISDYGRFNGGRRVYGG